MLKWIVGIIIILAAVGGGLYYSGWIGKMTTPAPEPQAQTQTPPPQQQVAQTPPPSDLPTASTDSSDTALTQDAAAIDAQLGNLTTDSASVDQSLNDKPVSQAY